MDIAVGSGLRKTRNRARMARIEASLAQIDKKIDALREETRVVMYRLDTINNNTSVVKLESKLTKNKGVVE